MGGRPTATVTSMVTFLFHLIILMRATADQLVPPPPSPNITTILAGDPRFTTFNHYLTTTGLSEIINNLTTGVTVCALDNSAMSDLLSLRPSPTSLRRLLLFHLFSGYSDAEMLNTCCAWTLYPRPSGGSNEVVDIGEIDGKTSFTFPYTADYSQLLGFVAQIPPHLSVLHVSKVLPSPEAWSLTSPIETLKIMARSGCGAFAGSVAEAAAAERWFRENAYVGMTVICPIDAAWEKFTPKFTALNEEDKINLLLFHAIPIYYDKCGIRWEDDGWRPATLASYYRGNGGAGEPTVEIAAVRRLIVGVGYDKGPLAVYPIRGVLVPDDPDGIVEYLDPNAAAEPAELATDEECRSWILNASAPVPQPLVADSEFVEDDNTGAAS